MRATAGRMRAMIRCERACGRWLELHGDRGGGRCRSASWRRGGASGGGVGGPGRCRVRAGRLEWRRRSVCTCSRGRAAALDTVESRLDRTGGLVQRPFAVRMWSPEDGGGANRRLRSRRWCHAVARHCAIDRDIRPTPCVDGLDERRAERVPLVCRELERRTRWQAAVQHCWGRLETGWRGWQPERASEQGSLVGAPPVERRWEGGLFAVHGLLPRRASVWVAVGEAAGGDRHDWNGR